MNRGAHRNVGTSPSRDTIPGPTAMDTNRVSASATCARKTASSSPGPKWHGPGADQGGELAEPSRIRTGEPGLGRRFRFFGEHFRFLRWDERGCGLTIERSTTCRSTAGSETSRTWWPPRKSRSRRDAGDLLRRRDLHRLRGAPSGAGLEADPLRRLRSRLGGRARRRPPVSRHVK